MPESHRHSADSHRPAHVADQVAAFLVRYPLVILALLVAGHTLLLLDYRALWFSDEVRYAEVFRELLNGHWLVLHLNGEMYPDKPPVYFWLLALLRVFTGSGPATLFLGSAVSGFAYLVATYLLARLVAGLDKATSLAAGLLLLGTLYFVGLMHYVRMDLLFGAFIVGSQIAFFRGLTMDGERRLLVLGFLLAAVATLTKGPLGLALPLVSLIVFAVITRRSRELVSRPALIGLGLMLGILAAWAVGAYIVEGRAYLDNIFFKQIVRRTVDTWHHNQPWHHYLWTLPLVWLPWSLLIFALPMWKLLTGEFWEAMAPTRPHREGWSYVWIMFLGGFLLLSVVSSKIVVYLLPLFAPLAVLSARGLLALPEQARGLFWSLAAGFLGLLALVLPFAEVLNPWGLHVIRGLGILTVVLALTAYLIWRWRYLPLAPIATLAVGVMLLVQPLGLMTLPSLDTVMSPKPQALKLRGYVEDGYAPAAWDIYSGIYTYYLDGGDVFETQDTKALVAFLQDHPKAILAIQIGDWGRMQESLGAQVANLKEVDRQIIVDHTYLLLIQDEAPATAVEQPAAKEAPAAVMEEPSKDEATKAAPEAVMEEPVEEQEAAPEAVIEEPAEEHEAAPEATIEESGEEYEAAPEAVIEAPSEGHEAAPETVIEAPAEEHEPVAEPAETPHS